jgi:hypothetical protein
VFRLLWWASVVLLCQGESTCSGVLRSLRVLHVRSLKPGSRAGPTASAEYESSIITETPKGLFKLVKGLNGVRKEEKKNYTRLQAQ